MTADETRDLTTRYVVSKPRVKAKVKVTRTEIAV